MSRKFLALHDKHRIYIPIPPQLRDKRVKEVQIIPVCRGRAFKIQYVYMCEPESQNLNPSQCLSIDIGVSNPASCISTTGTTFIVDGRRIKSINHRWNKEKARLQSIYMKQGIYTGRKLETLTQKRNEQVQYLIRKAARIIITHCLDNDIGTLIVGSNSGWKDGLNLGRVNNQNFTQIPFAYLRHMLNCHCERYGMRYIEQEESCTSQASFLDGDDIPAYKANDEVHYEFSGRRVKRGLYRSGFGVLVNADINGAANILRKSKQKFSDERLCKGLTVSPMRIRLERQNFA